MKEKPIAERISQWNSATEVIYACPKCKCSLGFYGTDEKFCHNCGQEIDWNVVIKVNKRWSNKYHGCETYQKAREVIEQLNAINQGNTFNYPVIMGERSNENAE